MAVNGFKSKAQDIVTHCISIYWGFGKSKLQIL